MCRTINSYEVMSIKVLVSNNDRQSIVISDYLLTTQTFFVNIWILTFCKIAVKTKYKNNYYMITFFFFIKLHKCLS